MKKYWIYKGFKMFFMMIFFIAFFGFITMSLWNWLIPDLFGLSTLSMAQAVGLVVLSKILFGNFPGRRWGNTGKSKWKSKMRERYENMSPEEKEKYKARFKNYCGSWTSDFKDESSDGTEIKPKTSS